MPRGLLTLTVLLAFRVVDAADWPTWRTTPGGFVSAVTFDFDDVAAWPEADWFAPGMICGGFENLTPTAIGGRSSYRPGEYAARIREDRLPAPLVVAHFRDGSPLAVLDPAPDGSTTAADSLDTEAKPMIDERFRFGAIGGQEREGKVSLGYWFPGHEGQVTYAGNTYPGGHLHKWRPRFHPVKDGLVQRYEVWFQTGRDERFPACFRRAWRSAWHTLDPKVTPHDLDAGGHRPHSFARQDDQFDIGPRPPIVSSWRPSISKSGYRGEPHVGASAAERAPLRRTAPRFRPSRNRHAGYPCGCRG